MLFHVHMTFCSSFSYNGLTEWQIKLEHLTPPASLDVLAQARNFWYSPTLSSNSCLESSTPTTITVTHSSVAYIEKDIISVFQRLLVLGSVVVRRVCSAAWFTTSEATS